MSIADTPAKETAALKVPLHNYLWSRPFIVLALGLFFLYFVFSAPIESTKLKNLYFLLLIYLLGVLWLLRLDARGKYLLLHFLADSLIISYLYTLYPIMGIPFSVFYLFPLFMGGLSLPMGQYLVMAFLIWGLFLGLSVANGEAWLFTGLHLFSFLMVGVASFVLRRDVIAMDKERIEAERWRNLYQTVVDYIPAGLTLIDKEGIIRAANPGAKRMIGTHVEGEEAKVFFPFIEGFSGKGVRERMEGELLKAQGDKVPVGFTLVPYVEGVEVLIFTDLTEIKRMEEEQRRSRFMAMLGRMSADLAHDLRNPLGAIKGAAEMLRSMDKPHGDLGQLMDIIVEEVDRLDVLITDFLVFASPSVGTVERAEVDVGCLLEEVCRKSPFNDKVSLEVRSSSLVIVGHEFQLERVFRNLLQNAVEADDKGLGVRIEAWKDDDSVSVKFEDHGVGISDMYKDEVFRPFFSTKPRGMGLGLSICQRIVEEHGGKIYLESRTGEGTVVTVLLPRGDGCA